MNQEELKLILKESENYFTEFKENLSKLDKAKKIYFRGNKI